jgi:hypothetical protein
MTTSTGIPWDESKETKGEMRIRWRVKESLLSSAHGSDQFFFAQ